MSTLCVTGGRVLLPDATIEEADVLVDGETGTIREIGRGLEGEAELDASDGLVIPGLVNAHTHVAMTLMRGYADDKELDRWLEEDIWPIEAELTGEDVYWGTKLGLLEMIESGTTAFSDMYFFVDAIADAVEEAGLRAVLGYGSITVGKDEEAARAEMERGLEVAEEVEEATGDRISTTYQPHSLTTVGEEYLREFVPEAREAGIPLHFHANETTDEVDPIVEERGVWPLEYADDLGMLGPDSYIAHGVHVDDHEIDLLAERETGVAHCPASNMKLASGMAPVQKLLDAGVTVGLGTDGAASNNDLDLFDEMRDAAMVGKLAAEDASAVDAPTVVEMATQNGADLLGVDAGRIEEGAKADIAVLDLQAAHLTPEHDLVSHLAYAARGSDVRHTICDGEVLMRDRDVLTLDAEAVREGASERAFDLVARAGNT